jgi:transcription elongation factor Elf1
MNSGIWNVEMNSEYYIFQLPCPDLSDPVDLYHEWIDACEKVNFEDKE